MRVLHYRGLDTRRVQKAFDKVRQALIREDFHSAQIKKLAPTPYWRARLDDSNRLLLQFVRHAGETVCLLLEVIPQHAYEKSRFLRGARIDPARIEADSQQDRIDVTPEPAAPTLRWLHPERSAFELLDKPIVFDDAQEAALQLPPPAVLVGPAGSGKTAVTLAKLRQASGRVLYVTLSAYLAQNARSLYDAHGYVNEDQAVEFLSLCECLETLQIPEGREVRFADFRGWFERHRQALRGELKELDAHALFEEFRGVIGAAPRSALDLAAYQALGVRQSLIPQGSARAAVHGLYGRYSAWLKEAGLFDLNQVAHAWMPLAEPVYDFAVIDEVQDLTRAQLALILACLKHPDAFLLCGDTHQIVHPNFFSWAAVRALFWEGRDASPDTTQPVALLRANFRNTQAVTQLGNRLLKIKHARFGSVDRESSFLIECATREIGTVQLLDATSATLREIDARTRTSARHAVIVLRDEDKPAAKAQFHTPLVFSVHEAKGLEYPHVVLFDLVSSQRAAFAEIAEGISERGLNQDDLSFRRARDKADKSLELYKFFVNALYVALTRASESLILVESDPRHSLLDLLGLRPGQPLDLAASRSSVDEWAQEARKLEQQGKQEQADAIRAAFLQTKPTPWKPWSEALIRELLPRALDPRDPSNKLRQTLFDYALWHGQHAWIEQLAEKTRFAPALSLAPQGALGGIPLTRGFIEHADKPVLRAISNQRERWLRPYAARNIKEVLADGDRYGVDHLTPTGGTPLMCAAQAGNLPLVDALLSRGASPEQADDFGHTPWLAALNVAIEDPATARNALGSLFERLAPGALDVQVDHRLVRLERSQAEYWVLSVMLAGLKTLGMRVSPRPLPIQRYRRGFFADAILAVLETLPEALWPAARRKRTYINHVLARAELGANYRPARQLWVRVQQGYYMPNPAMKLRASRQADSTMGWVDLDNAFNLAWVTTGSDAWPVIGLRHAIAALGPAEQVVQ
ncbi:Ankyrin [mine drainage metagenome]|uniref:Ankyrin n=2 Tax=mine drainage metagenome TaxID=410659 RepID=T1D426_9ZZZZ